MSSRNTTRRVRQFAAAVAIPLALSVINVQAQEADDLQPRAGETVLEHKARTAKTKGDREALREALRDAKDKAHFEAMREM